MRDLGSFAFGKVSACCGLIALFVSAACSLLAPGDDSLLAGGKNDASTDARVDAPTGEGDVSRDAQSEGACAEWQECAAGEYCLRGRCRPCTDLDSGTDPSELAFGEAQSLGGVNANVSVEMLRFPRAFATGSQLIYTRDYFGGQMWLSEDFSQNTGAPLASPLDAPGLHESAPLKIGWPLTGALAGLNFFFDRKESADGGSSRVDLFGASIGPSGTAMKVVRLPVPFNAALPTRRWSYGLALSRSHAFWMVNNDGALDLHLLSMKLDGQGIPTDIVLEVPPGCTNRE
ncbi:MAG TPA: hypothetical protein VK524_24350, partial [Polyangiaceae bacterium]|nr:hypothetical protein [Polyangiaceae bacterium]